MKSGALDEEENQVHVETYPRKGVNRGLSILDAFLRFIAAAGALGSAVAMGTTNETLPFISQFFQFQAQYDDLPTLTFFVIANAIVGGYLVLTLPVSVYHIMRSKAKVSRVMLIIFDTVMLGLVTAGASAAAGIVYLAHKGNSKANWFAICQQFNSFCKRISGSLVGSFSATVMLIIIISTAAIAISRR